MSRLSSFVCVATVGLLTSCYKPQLGDGPGYYCHANDNPACPDGQVCIGGRCYSKGAAPGGDMSMSGGDGGGGNQDFSTGNHDMSMGGQHDFATNNPDLSQSGNLCMCPTVGPCLLMCVGQDCCGEEAAFGLCTADPNCTPN